jgi:hypothetical protein
MHMQVTVHLSDPGRGPDHPRGPGGLPSTFLAWMVGAPEFSGYTSQGGPLPIFFNVDGGRSQITISTRQGVHHRRFLALILGAPEFSGYTS